MDKIYRAWVHFCDMCGYRFIVNIEEDVIKDMICPGCQGKLKRRTSWIKEIVPGAVKKIKKEKNGGGMV